MSDTLPPLPEPENTVLIAHTERGLTSTCWRTPGRPYYTADQMRSYAAAALAAAVAEPVAWLDCWGEPHRNRSDIGGDVAEPLYAAPPQREPLREGEVMGAYMEFDRTADRAWTNAEYLVRFGLHISKLTAHVISAPKEQA